MTLISVSLLGACASIPAACRNLSGVTARTVTTAEGRTFLVGYDYSSESSRVAHMHCLAEEGQQDAQVELARRYEAGDGVPLDPARAAQLYERAATAIPPTTAIYSPPIRLGGAGQVMFLNNPNARPGSAEAKFRLGRLLSEGRGIERDERRGRALIEEAARQGSAEAAQWLREQ